MVSKKERAVLLKLQSYFGVGKIYDRKTDSIYRVTVLKELINVISSHFCNYPLLTKKSVTFKLWKSALDLFEKKAHLTDKGFLKILSIYSTIGRGISENIKRHFPNLKPTKLPEYLLVVNSKKINNWWLSGYLTNYCSFEATILAGRWKNEFYNKLRYRFSISRDISEIEIMKVIADYFNTEIFVRSDDKRVDITINRLEIALKLIPFFDNYPLQSTKNEQYLIWKDFIILANSHISIGSGPSYSLPIGWEKRKPFNDNDMKLFFELSDKLNKLKDND